MKITKHILPVICLLICALLLASPAMAQTNTAATNSETAALANAVSNTPESETTNDDGMSASQDNAQPIVLFGQNAELKTNDTAEAVVVIGGSAVVHGRVHDAVVVIGGNLEVDGDVGDAVVAILGNVHIKPGATIHQDAVAVMGSAATPFQSAERLTWPTARSSTARK